MYKKDIFRMKNLLVLHALLLVVSIQSSYAMLTNKYQIYNESNIDIIIDCGGKTVLLKNDANFNPSDDQCKALSSAETIMVSCRCVDGTTEKVALGTISKGAFLHQGRYLFWLNTQDGTIYLEVPRKQRSGMVSFDSLKVGSIKDV